MQVERWTSSALGISPSIGRQIGSSQRRQAINKLRNVNTSRLGVEIFIAIVFGVILAANEVDSQLAGLPPSAHAPNGGRPQQPAANFVLVPGNSNSIRDPNRVDRVIYPYESFETANPNHRQAVSQTSYVIDNKRFVESYSSRCMASTLLEDPDSVEPNFVVITSRWERRVNATAPIEAIRATGYEPSLPTYIFVHGFTQSYPDTDWLRRTRALFEKHSLIGKQNLIFMDWGTAAQGSYSQVAARTSGMGSFLANFLMKLFEMGADRRAVHIVGHSLGAHIAGFAGKRIRPRIGRITGLDAAGPCFGKFLSNSANDRLAHDDAHEVDVYHYDDSFLGLSGQIGQFDVLVNGGSSQPGCTDNMNTMAQALVTMVFRRNRPLSESHTRSTEVATSQLSLSNCQMIAYECRDWPAFMSGECGFCDQANNQCFDMAFHYQYSNRGGDSIAHVPPLRHSSQAKRMYISTGQTGLFCLQHFQILVRFEPAPDLANLAKKQRWRLHLELINDLNGHLNFTITNQFEPNVFSHLLLGETQPRRFKSALLQVRQGDNTPVQMREKEKAAVSRPYSNLIRVHSIEVNFMSSIQPGERRALSSRLCPSGWLEAENSIGGSSSYAQDLDWLTLSEC